MKRLLAVLALILAPMAAAGQRVISDYTPAPVMNRGDKLLLQQGGRTVPYTYGTVQQLFGAMTNSDITGALGFSPLNKAGDNLTGPVTSTSDGIAISLNGTGAMKMPAGTTAQQPSAGNVGEFRYNTTTGNYEFGTGSSWMGHLRLDGGTLTGPVSSSANGIAVSLNGTGATKVPVGTTGQQPDSGTAGLVRFNSSIGRPEFGYGGAWKSNVKLDGDTMTGPLTLPNDPVSALQAATKQYADTKLSLTGGTLSGGLALPSATIGGISILPEKPARDFARSNPSFLTPRDVGSFGGVSIPGVVGNARQISNPTNTTSGSTALELAANYYYLLGTSVTCVSGSPNLAVTVPTGVSLPQYLVEPNTTTGAINITNATAGGCWSSAKITGITGSSPNYTVTINVNASSSATFTGGFVIAQAGTSGGGGITGGAPFTPANGNGSSVSVVTQCATSGATLVCPSGTFNTNQRWSDTSNGDRSTQHLRITDLSGTCSEQDFQINSSTTTTATLATTPGCAISNSNYVQLWQGPLLFTAGMVGQTADVANAGAALAAPLTGSDDWISTIASYVDAFHVNLSAPAGTSRYQLANQVTVGTDDTAALNALFQAASQAGYSSVYFPPDVYPFFVTPNFQYMTMLQLCSDSTVSGGRIIYPNNATGIRNTTRCTSLRPYPAPEPTLVAADHLRQVRLKYASGGNVVVDELGDSMCQAASNQLNEFGSLSRIVDLAIRAANPGVSPDRIVTNNRCIGSQTMTNVDPAGPDVSGNGPGIPSNAAQSVTSWYATPSNTWISYLQADCPDLIAIRFGNDNQNLNISSWQNVIAYTQRAAWKTACGSNPDIVIIATGFSPQSNSQLAGYVWQENMLYMSRWTASAVRAGLFDGYMALGGKVGLIDGGRRDILYQTGVDVGKPIMRRDKAAVIQGGLQNASNSNTFPYTWPTQVMGWEGNWVMRWTGNIDAATFWTNYGVLTMGLGNGAYGSPQSIGGQGSNTFTTGYPGNQLAIGRDSGGNYWVEGDVYSFTQTATVSITNGAAVLTCSVSCANYGHAYAQISIPGAGAAACPWQLSGQTNCLNTTIGTPGVTSSPISADGKTLTLSANASATLSAVSKTIWIGLTFYPKTVTNIPVAVTSGAFTIANLFAGQKDGMAYATLANNGGGPRTFTSVFAGNIVTFGGHYQPILAASNCNSSCTTLLGVTGLIGQSSMSSFKGDHPVHGIANTGNEAYGSCIGGAPGGTPGNGPYGGQCSAHQSTLGITAYDDVLAANTLQLAFDAPGPPPTPVNVGNGVASVSALCNQIILINDTTAPTVNLPAKCPMDQPIMVQDIGAQATAHNITITAPTGTTLNGSNNGSVAITTNYNWARITYNGSTAAVSQRGAN